MLGHGFLLENIASDSPGHFDRLTGRDKRGAPENGPDSEREPHLALRLGAMQLAHNGFY